MLSGVNGVNGRIPQSSGAGSKRVGPNGKVQERLKKLMERTDLYNDEKAL